jgi:putative transposase
MKGICQAAGISRQALHQHPWDEKETFDLEEGLLKRVEAIRKKHPTMGARKLYKKLSPLPMGRDRFETLLLSRGYRVRPVKNFIVTTHRHRRYLDFPNLCAGLKIQRLNHVWVSDITYILFQDRFYYLVLEEDIYSRRILGNSVSASLEATENVIALKQAFRRRGIRLYGYELIHHSDPGSQYLSNDMLRYLRKRECLVSTSRSVYENSHIERLNGIIKNEYLRHYRPKDLAHLRRLVNDAVWCYNNERPHWSLSLKTPIEFEQSLEDLAETERPVMTLYSMDEEKTNA